MTLRALTNIDGVTREALAIELGQRLRGAHVAETKNRQPTRRKSLTYLFVDSDSECHERPLDLCAHHKQVRIDKSRLGNPVDTCFVETFNGWFRDDYLNVHSSQTITQALQMIEAWPIEYDESCRHMALGNVAPLGFAF